MITTALLAYIPSIQTPYYVLHSEPQENKPKTFTEALFLTVPGVTGAVLTGMLALIASGLLLPRVLCYRFVWAFIGF